MAQTDIDRLAAILRDAPCANLTPRQWAQLLLDRGVTLPPAPDPEAWVEEAARVARGQRNTHTRRLTCDT